MWSLQNKLVAVTQVIRVSPRHRATALLMSKKVVNKGGRGKKTDKKPCYSCEYEYDTNSFSGEQWKVAEEDETRRCKDCITKKVTLAFMQAKKEGKEKKELPSMEEVSKEMNAHLAKVSKEKGLKEAPIFARARGDAPQGSASATDAVRAAPLPHLLPTRATRRTQLAAVPPPPEHASAAPIADAYARRPVASSRRADGDGRAGRRRGRRRDRRRLGGERDRRARGRGRRRRD